MSLSKPQFDLFLTQLPQLSPKQAAEVTDHITALFGENSNSTSHWLLDGAFVELRRRGLMSKVAPPFNIMKSWSKNLDNQLNGIEAFLFKAVNPRDPAEKSALAQICFAALCNWLTERCLPLSLRMVIINVGNIPQALDSAFPGYVSAGVLGMLLKEGKVPLNIYEVRHDGHYLGGTSIVIAESEEQAIELVKAALSEFGLGVECIDVHRKLLTDAPRCYVIDDGDY